MVKRFYRHCRENWLGNLADGFSLPNLFRMVRFAEVFPEEKIVVTVSRQLGWSHLVEIIPLDDDLKRDFYAEMCRIERWSVRTLGKKSPVCSLSGLHSQRNRRVS